ncbi:MAG: tetratricopeptide repeat protein [Gammaproteobacteria bacterium]|nr:tetratricopeptide repeat protein [Gammaproteobacteria bacterium]
MNCLSTFLRRLPLAVVVCGLLSISVPGYAGDDKEGDNAAARIEAAESALERHEYKVASWEYRKAAEISSRPEVAQQATRVAYSFGFDRDALASAKRWVLLDKESDEALLYVALLQLRTDDIWDSRRSFRQLLKQSDEPPEDRLVALIPFLSQEDPDKADRLMRQLARPYKDSSQAHYAVAVMAMQSGDLEEAQKRARKAIELDDEWIKPHLVYARSLLLDGDEEGAIDYTARLIGDSPDPDPEARLELALMLLSAGRDDDALSQVNQILLEQPSRTDALRLMAIINFRLERLDAARADFEDLLATGRYTMDALYYLGRIADINNDHERAIELYSQVVQGSNAVLSQRRASGIMSQNGDEEAALQHLRDFGEKHPNYAVEMIEAEAQLLASLERYPDALEKYDRVVSYRPDDEGALLGRAELLLRMGRLDAAIKQYREAVDRWPDSAISLNALGYTLADRTERYNEAERLIRKALKLDPDSPAIIDSWGWVLYRKGKNEQALTELQRAYEKLRDPEVAAHIVEVLWKLDRIEEAQEFLADAELLYPDSELLHAVREKAFPQAN